MAAGLAAGAVACTATYPLEALRWAAACILAPQDSQKQRLLVCLLEAQLTFCTMAPPHSPPHLPAMPTALLLLHSSVPVCRTQVSVAQGGAGSSYLAIVRSTLAGGHAAACLAPHLPTSWSRNCSWQAGVAPPFRNPHLSAPSHTTACLACTNENLPPWHLSSLCLALLQSAACAAVLAFCGFSHEALTSSDFLSVLVVLQSAACGACTRGTPPPWPTTRWPCRWALPAMRQVLYMLCHGLLCHALLCHAAGLCQL